jgi:tetratricopeptide (TPR) repeat protein
MPALVPTLNALLEHADQLFEADRLGKALAAYESLVSVSQDKADRATEGMCRSRIAECLLLRQDPDAAREQLEHAANVLDPSNRKGMGRYRWAAARLCIATESAAVVRAYLQEYVAWGDSVADSRAVIDGCVLLADQSDNEGRIQWLERALQVGQETQTSDRLGRICNDLAASLDEAGRIDEALEAYELALGWQRLRGSLRDQVGACWAIGAVALRQEDFPLAAARLEEAISLADEQVECQDLLALALGDLAWVQHGSGDEIEARRVLIRALHHATEVELSSAWRHAWEQMQNLARKLDLSP